MDIKYNVDEVFVIYRNENDEVDFVWGTIANPFAGLSNGGHESFVGETVQELYSDDWFFVVPRNTSFGKALAEHAKGTPVVFFKPEQLELSLLLALIDDEEDVEVLHFPKSDWQYEVTNGDTKLGYREWLLHRLESEFGE